MRPGKPGKVTLQSKTEVLNVVAKSFLMVDMDIPPYIGCIYRTISLSTSNDGPVKMATSFSREKGRHFTTYNKGVTLTVKAPATSSCWARASKRGSDPFLPMN